MISYCETFRMLTRRLQIIHGRFERHGVDQWVPTLRSESNTHWEMTPEAYSRTLGFLRTSAGAGARAGGVTDLGAGCGLGVAHAVGSGIFKHARGVEIEPVRYQAAQLAISDLKLTAHASVALGTFLDPSYVIETPCALCMDVAFSRSTICGLAEVLERSPSCRSFLSFRPQCRWEAGGLTSFDMVRTGRVQSSGGDRFTFFVYKRK